MSRTPIKHEGFAVFMDKGFDAEELTKFHQEVSNWIAGERSEDLSTLNLSVQKDILKAYRKYVRGNYPALDISAFYDEEGHMDGYVVFAAGSQRITTSDVFVATSPKDKEQMDAFRGKFIPRNAASFYQWKSEG